MVRPIPAYLLPSAATVWVPVEGDYGGTFSEEPRTIDRVRFDRYTAAERMAYAAADGAQGKLYVDAVTSGGAFEVPVGSKVVVGGSEPMEAMRVDRYEDTNGHVHHWEIELR